MADDETLRRRSKQLRRHQTNAEALLWSVLRDRRLEGFKFRRQVVIASYIVDFLCSRARLIVEVDGATHSTPKELAYDEERELVLSRLGFRILRVGNLDVYQNIFQCSVGRADGFGATDAGGRPLIRPSGAPSPRQDGEKGIREVAYCLMPTA